MSAATRSRKVGEPQRATDRLAAAKRRDERGASQSAIGAAKSLPQRSRIGAVATTPSSRWERWARTLDQRQSSARLTSLARTGLSATWRAAAIRCASSMATEPVRDGNRRPVTRSRALITLASRRRLLAERAPEPLRRRRRQDQMDVVRHQAVRPHRHARLAAALAQQVEIETIILVAEERLHPPIAAPRHVIGQIRDDETGDAGPWRGSWPSHRNLATALAATHQAVDSWKLTYEV